MISLSVFPEPERPDDEQAVEALQALAFGPDRFKRAAYRLRAGLRPIKALSHVMRNEDRVVGSIRYAPVNISGHDGLMLGPLVVHPDHIARGYGLALARFTLDLAASTGHEWVVLVGDEPYYERLGFCRIPAGRIVLEGHMDDARLLLRELVPGCAVALSGRIEPGHVS